MKVVVDGEQLPDEPGPFHVEGARAGAPVELSVGWRAGTASASSRAWFVADAAGRVDPRRQPAFAGAYLGLDPFGLFWSARAADGSTPAPVDDNLEVEIHARCDDDLAVGSYLLLARGADVIVTEIEEEGLVARLFQTAGPGVVVLGGSDGGLGTAGRIAGLLSSRGMTALALGYFDLPGLPQQLVGVAVETVARGLERLTELTNARPALLGISRGAELALLASSIYPDLVRRAAAVVPSLYLWPGLATPNAAAWTMAGQPLPFIPDEPEAAAAEVALVNHSTDPAAPYMEAALAIATGVQREAARIRLEDITAPVLLVSGAADALWPSAAQCLTAIEELADDRYQHLSYAGAGHRLSAFPTTPMSTSMTTADGFHLQFGGSVQATAAASADLWARLPTWLKAGD
ncbi:MAG: hypothetical protein QOG10_4722 [Kribbellaceae bacterium]|nr:hypothetical protein [Kribbellaceae bacterium]